MFRQSKKTWKEKKDVLLAGYRLLRGTYHMRVLRATCSVPVLCDNVISTHAYSNVIVNVTHKMWILQQSNDASVNPVTESILKRFKAVFGLSSVEILAYVRIWVSTIFCCILSRTTTFSQFDLKQETLLRISTMR